VRPFGSGLYVLAGIAWAAIGARPARAQGNDRSAPIGGRSALMGNTGVALAEDGAAPFLNPATMVRINDQSLAFSVNFFTLSGTRLANWHQPAPADASQFGDVTLDNTSVSSTSFNVLPSTLCLFFTVAGVTAEGEPVGVLHKGRQKLAVCVGSLEANNLGLGALAFNGTTPSGTTSQVQSFTANWNRLYVGPSYSLSLSDDFAVGLSLHGVGTNDTFDVEASSITSTTAGGSIQSAIGTSGSGHAVDLTAIVGAIYRLGPITLGASFQTPSIHFYGSYNGTLHNEYAGAGTTESATVLSGSGSFSAPPPVRASFGIGASLKRFTLELDASYDFALSNTIQTTLTQTSATTTGTATSTTTGTATYELASRPMFNLAGGFEYFLSPSFSVIAGASSNVSTLYGLAPTMTLGNLVATKNDLLTASFGIGSYGAEGNILIGVEVGYGWGQALGVSSYVVPNDWAVIDTQSYSATLILAGATNLRAITRAVEKVQSVMTTGKPDDAKPAPPPP
jgi:hypothetical protein